MFRVVLFIGVLELDLFFTLLLAENSKKARQAKPTPVTPFVKLLVIIQTGHAIPMQEFTADLKHRMRGVWRDAELVDPNTHNNKLATYHSWFAIPFSRNERMPINVPRYLHLDLSKHVMRNITGILCAFVDCPSSEQ